MCLVSSASRNSTSCESWPENRSIAGLRSRGKAVGNPTLASRLGAHSMRSEHGKLVVIKHQRPPDNQLHHNSRPSCGVSRGATGTVLPRPARAPHPRAGKDQSSQVAYGRVGLQVSRVAQSQKGEPNGGQTGSVVGIDDIGCGCGCLDRHLPTNTGR